MIRRFYVNNFRCLENFELRLAEFSSVLLIGGNGAGKTTVRNALEKLQAIARGTNRIRDILEVDDLSYFRVAAQVLPESEPPMRFELEAEIEGRLYRYVLALDLPEGFKELRVAEEGLTIDGTQIYARTLAQVVLSRAGDNAEAKFLVDWHLAALPVIQQTTKDDPVGRFKKWLGNMLILAPVPSLIGGESNNVSDWPSVACENFAAWWSGLVAFAPAEYGRMANYLKLVMPDFQDVQNPSTARNWRTLSVNFEAKSKTLNVPFGRLSDGEKCYFICAAVLSAQRVHGPLVCFWDEPDNYLALSEVGHFVGELRRAFKDGGQFIATSHNAEAVRQFNDENTLLLARASHLEPTQNPRPVADLGIQGDLVDALVRGDEQQ